MWGRGEGEVKKGYHAAGDWTGLNEEIRRNGEENATPALTPTNKNKRQYSPEEPQQKKYSNHRERNFKSDNNYNKVISSTKQNNRFTCNITCTIKMQPLAK